MIRHLVWTLILACLLSSCSGGIAMIQGNSSPSVPLEIDGGWKLAWNDEFDSAAGTTPDPAKWAYDTGGEGWGNREWEFYTDAPENASTDGEGFLVIRAQAVEDPATSGLSCWYGACTHTSARLLTRERFEFTYGRVEARMKLPFGQGIWPAFWMLGNDIDEVGWPACGEIDIMENIGREPATVHGTIHGPGYSGAAGIGNSYSLAQGEAFKDDFHLFVLEWEADELRWYVDNTLFGTISKAQFSESKPWVFDHPHFILLNLAVGGNWPGYPDATTTFPQELVIDYVRVYQK